MSLQAVNLNKCPMYDKMSLHTTNGCVTAGTSTSGTQASTGLTVQADCRVYKAGKALRLFIRATVLCGKRCAENWKLPLQNHINVNLGMKKIISFLYSQQLWCFSGCAAQAHIRNFIYSRITLGLDDVRGIFQPKWFYDFKWQLNSKQALLAGKVCIWSANII